MEVENPFVIDEEALRYDRYRPQYHDIPFGLIKQELDSPLESVLDVACGTGHSTKALAKISESVVGCDLSPSMLQVARKNLDVEFVCADAQKLPFDNNQFDLVNISMAFHWVDQEKFFAEALRVLKPGGYLCIESFGFKDREFTDPEKMKLHDDLFQRHLPSASRRKAFPDFHQVAQNGFRLFKEINYDHQVSMKADEFINLVKTWSNFQILSKEEKKQVAEKMCKVYSVIFANKSLDLKFSGRVFLLKTSDSY